MNKNEYQEVELANMDDSSRDDKYIDEETMRHKGDLYEFENSANKIKMEYIYQ